MLPTFLGHHNKKQSNVVALPWQTPPPSSPTSPPQWARPTPCRASCCAAAAASCAWPAPAAAAASRRCRCWPWPTTHGPAAPPLRPPPCCHRPRPLRPPHPRLAPPRPHPLWAAAARRPSAREGSGAQPRRRRTARRGGRSSRHTTRCGRRKRMRPAPTTTATARARVVMGSSVMSRLSASRAMPCSACSACSASLGRWHSIARLARLRMCVHASHTHVRPPVTLARTLRPMPQCEERLHACPGHTPLPTFCQ